MKLEVRDNPDGPKCKGFVFRFRRNAYASNGKIVFADEWRLMKSLSCRGDCCDENSRRRCFSPFDDVEEVGIENLRIVCDDEPVDGQLYRAMFRPEPPDFETGHVEEWDWSMVRYEEGNP